MTHTQHDRIALTVAAVSLALFVAFAFLSGCVVRVECVCPNPQFQPGITLGSKTLEITPEMMNGLRHVQ